MKKILFLLLLTVSVYGQNPSRFAKIQITGNTTSATAAKVNVQESNGEVNTQTINSGFNKNIGLGNDNVVGSATLLNQYSTTPADWVAQSYSLGSIVFYAGKQWIAKSATISSEIPATSPKWADCTFEALANSGVTVDQTIIDGSTNPVSGNAVFDGLAGKQTTISGTANYLTKYGIGGVVQSQIFEDVANVGIGTNTVNSKLNIVCGNNDGIKIESFNSGFFEVGKIGGYLWRWQNDYSAANYFELLKGSSPSNLTSVITFSGIGNLLVNTTTDDLTNKLQVNGTISANAGTQSNQVVVNSQLYASVPKNVFIVNFNMVDNNIDSAKTTVKNTVSGSYTISHNGSVFQCGFNGYNFSGKKVSVKMSCSYSYNDGSQRSISHDIFPGATLDFKVFNKDGLSLSPSNIGSVGVSLEITEWD